MSVEALNWAFQQQAVTDPAARSVLFGLANHANHEGRHAFPSVNVLCRYTGLSRRTVLAKIKLLLDHGLISLGNQRVAVAIIDRADRRPIVYDLALGAGLNGDMLGDEESVPTEERGATETPRDVPQRGEADAPRNPNGVQMTTERGARAAPEPSLTINPSLSETCANDFPSMQPVEAMPADEVPTSAADQYRSGVIQRLPMQEHWRPDANELVARLVSRGVRPEAAQVLAQDQAWLMDFCEHYSEKPDRAQETASGWIMRLARWLHSNWQRLGAPQRLNDFPVEYLNARGYEVHDFTGGSHAQRSAARNGYSAKDRVDAALANPDDLSWAAGLIEP